MRFIHDGQGSRRVGRAKSALGCPLAILVAATMLVGSAIERPAEAQLPPVEGFADLVEQVGPAVVNISTTRRTNGVDGPEFPLPQFPPGSPFEDFFREFFDREQREQPNRRQPRESFSLGSGFVIDPSGFVVTNNHVIAEADEIKVIFSDNAEYAATLIGRDPKTDLALLKIERDEPFPHVSWADSDAIRVGDWMIAIGNPFGLGSTVTAGIVSARGRDIRAGPYDDFIQVDAAINRGNSGGPSFTLDGHVFGVNTAIFSPSGGNVGIGFAIPANLARPVIASLMEHGRVIRGWLGVRIQSVTPEIADSLGLPDPEGALVASVTPDGPAARSEIEAGDVILQFDGKRISAMRGLPRIVAETEVGKAVEVEIWRRGERRTIEVTLGELPSDEELAQLGDTPRPGQPETDRVEVPDLGLTVATISGELRETFGIDDDLEGVVIVEVMGGSAASEHGLRPGDVILEIGQEPVSSPAEVAARVAEEKEKGRRSMLLLVDSQGDLRFVALRLPPA